MRNSDKDGIDFISAGLDVPFNVVFNSPYGLVHRKNSHTAKEVLRGYYFVMESISGGFIEVLHYTLLWAIPKKQGTPAKPKKPHVKGTKPHLGYNPERIKPGVKVKLRNGLVTTVSEVDKCSGVPSLELQGVNGWLYLHNGREYCDRLKSGKDLIRILDNPVEPVKEEKIKEYYAIGDVFAVTSTYKGGTTKYVCMIISATEDKFGLVSLYSGGRYFEPVEIIPEYGFSQIPAKLVKDAVNSVGDDFDKEYKYIGNLKTLGADNFILSKLDK